MKWRLSQDLADLISIWPNCFVSQLRLWFTCVGPMLFSTKQAAGWVYQENCGQFRKYTHRYRANAFLENNILLMGIFCMQRTETLTDSFTLFKFSLQFWYLLSYFKGTHLTLKLKSVLIFEIAHLFAGKLLPSVLNFTPLASVFFDVIWIMSHCSTRLTHQLRLLLSLIIVSLRLRPIGLLVGNKTRSTLQLRCAILQKCLKTLLIN